MRAVGFHLETSGTNSRELIVELQRAVLFVETIRSPLLDEVPPLSHYLTVLAVTVIGFALAYFVHRKMRRQLAFFV